MSLAAETAGMRGSMVARMHSRVVAALCASMAVALSGCGEGEPDQAAEGASLKPPAAEVGGPTAALSGSGFQSVVGTAASLSPEGRSLVVGHVEVGDGSDASRTELRLLIGGQTVKQASTGVLRGREEASLVIACVCRAVGEGGRVEIEARGPDGVEIAGRSLAIIDDVEPAGGQTGSSLPAPLVAAAVNSSPGRIGSRPNRLVSAELPAATDGDKSLLVVGAVRARRMVELDNLQIDAVIGETRSQPIGRKTSPGKYVGIYAGESAGDGGGTVALRSGTAAGSTPIGSAAIFVCACAPSS